MIPKLQPLVLTLILALCLVKAAASPVQGTWDGTHDGARAATRTITEKDGILGGSVVFYILRDNGDGTHNGSALPAQRLSAVEWDGRTLRFDVSSPDGKTVAFDMRLTGEGKAELRVRGGDHPYEIVPMVLRK